MPEPSVLNVLPTETPPTETPPTETPPTETPPTETPPELTPEEQKVADDKAAAEKKEADSKKEGAPEKYKDFNFPEGVKVDQESLDKFIPLAKELDLSQEQAQKLVDFRSDAVESESKRQWDNWENTQKEWVKESRSDKDIGGEKFDENIGIAKKAMDAYGNDALRDLSDATGMGNNKEFIRFLVKIGNDISEDKLRVSGSQIKEGTRESRIYDKTV